MRWRSRVLEHNTQSAAVVCYHTGMIYLTTSCMLLKFFDLRTQGIEVLFRIDKCIQIFHVRPTDPPPYVALFSHPLTYTHTSKQHPHSSPRESFLPTLSSPLYHPFSAYTHTSHPLSFSHHRTPPKTFAKTPLPPSPAAKSHVTLPHSCCRLCPPAYTAPFQMARRLRFPSQESLLRRWIRAKRGH